MFIYYTRSQAVARIADRSLYCLTVDYKPDSHNSNDKSKPLTKFEVTSSNSFEDMFDRMSIIVVVT